MEKVNYKLLVADDEYWTREKIRTMIDWKEYHIAFMKPAENGEEVLLRMQEETPDILITDINMPFVNGVELVREVKERYPDVVIFIISGYDDFSYVKETLVAGAINYLLKPVSKVELIGAVSKALEIIGKREEDKRQILKASSLLQDRELSLLVEREQSPFLPQVTFDGTKGMAGCSVMLVKIHELQKYMEDYRYDMNLLSYSMKKKMKEITGMEELLIFNHIFRSNEFIIVTEADLDEQKKMAAKILGWFSKETKSPVTIAVSEHTYTMESLHNAYVQSVSVLMMRPFNRRNIVMFCNQEEQNSRKKVTNRIDQECGMKMKGLLKSGNGRALKELMRKGIGLERCAEEEWDYLEVRQTVKRFCNLIMDTLLQEERQESLKETENLAEIADKTVEKLDVALLCEILSQIVDSVTETSGDAAGSIREIVKSAADYIERNYFEELTLTSLSEKFCVESSYFSRIFKQETGKNLMLYIAETRIAKAKEYMKDETVNLTEIAFLTGYDDYTYFSRVFKKMTGKSPREYRSEQR